jgi:hypothetical protein
MNALLSESPDDRTPDRDHRFSCRRRIRGTMYVWGSQGITSNLHFASPLILYLRNDAYGESITISTVQADGTSTNLGTLDAGEYVSIPIQDISGVSVTCNLESTVSCVLSGDPGERRFLNVEPEHLASIRRPSTF